MAPIQFSMKTIGVPLVLLILFYLSFSVSNRHQNLLLSFYDFLVVSNTKPGRFAFFVVFNFITVIISFGSSKTPEADLEGSFSQTSLLYESNFTTIDLDDKFYCSNNVADNTIDIDDKFYCSNNVADNEHQGYDGSIEDSDEDIKSDDIGSEEEDDDDKNNTDSEMEKRAEEFIAKVKQKWREELLTDRLLCITAA